MGQNFISCDRGQSFLLPPSLTDWLAEDHLVWTVLGAVELSFTEREKIAVLLARGAGVREIARRLGRAPSTISRELQRNAAIGRGRVEYRASTAQRHAKRRAQRRKPARLAVNPDLRVAFGSQFKGRDLMFEPRPRPAQSPSTNPTASGVGQLADRAGR